MATLLKKLIANAAVPLGTALENAKRRIERATLPRFANTPRNLLIELPRRIINPERMTIGDDVSIGPGALLLALTHYPTGPMRNSRKAPAAQRFEPRIVIGHRVTATSNLTLGAANRIVIEDDVILASNINLTDNLHGYENVEIPYKDQPLGKIAPIAIGRGCWIGQNVTVLPGVTIGEMSIIGAHSIVIRDIPARCIAFGAPARVVKRWDEAGQVWI